MEWFKCFLFIDLFLFLFTRFASTIQKKNIYLIIHCWPHFKTRLLTYFQINVLYIKFVNIYFFKVHVWSFWLIDKMLLINKIKRQHDIKLSYLFYNRKVHVDKDRQYCRKWIFTDLKMHCLVIDIDNHNVLEIVNFLYVKTLKKPVSLTMSSQLTSKLGTRWFYFFSEWGWGSVFFMQVNSLWLDSFKFFDFNL